MKVIHFLHSDRFSGAENVVCQIISMMSDEDIEFVYVSRDGQIREALLERGIRFVPVTETSVSEYKRVIKEEHPDLIHAHDLRASFIASLACSKLPLICHVHNNHADARGFSLKSVLFKYAANKARHIFWVSQSSFDGYAYHKGLESKSSILYNIIDTDALREKAKLDTVTYDYDIVYCGRLTYQKHPERLLEVYKKVAQSRPETTFAIIGTGELEEEMQTLAEGLANVSMLGFNSNPYKIIADSKVMLMTSRWEGTPMVALEAMSLGTPIVSTPTDGMNDLIVDGETGYLSDDDDVIASDILALLDDNDKRDAMSDKCRSSIEEMMNMEEYKRKILEQYRR